jgi:hypothetical protein
VKEEESRRVVYSTVSIPPEHARPPRPKRPVNARFPRHQLHQGKRPRGLDAVRAEWETALRWAL